VQLPRNHWALYFWPGLPQLWNRGSWAGLLVAVGFTAVLNVLLLATLVFSEWLTVDERRIAGGALLGVWLLARWQSRAERRANGAAAADSQTGAGARAGSDEAGDEAATERSDVQPVSERDELFRAAQGHYLRNDWVATEQVLLKLLKQDARDVESRLMLATLWRHQQRGTEALRQLDRIDRLEAASKWQREIAAERMAIAHAEEPEEPEQTQQAQQADQTGDADQPQADNDQADGLSHTPPESTEAEPAENHDHRDDEQQEVDPLSDDSWDQRRAA
jgi:hypothetical protein